MAVRAQGWSLVCGNPSHGVGLVQHIPGLPLLAAGASGGWCGLLHTLLGPHHWQCHVLCPTGQCLSCIVPLGLAWQRVA